MADRLRLPGVERHYPDATFVLTVRTPESWAESFSATIYKFLSERDQAPPEMQAWLQMSANVVAKTGFPSQLEVKSLSEAFTAHNQAVKAAIPADRLLAFQVKNGWAPLYEFLGQTAPDEALPRTNDRTEFWALVSGKA